MCFGNSGKVEIILAVFSRRDADLGRNWPNSGSAKPGLANLARSAIPQTRLRCLIGMAKIRANQNRLDEAKDYLQTAKTTTPTSTEITTWLNELAEMK